MTHPYRSCITAFLILTFGASCAARTEAGSRANRAKPPALIRHEFESPALSTATFRVVVYCEDKSAAARVEDLVINRLAELDDVFDAQRPHSSLSQVYANAGVAPVRASPELYRLLHDVDRLAERARGAFDVTSRAYADLWAESFDAGQFPPTDALAIARDAVGREKLRLDPINRTVYLTEADVRLDLDVVVRGFVCDRLLSALANAGFPSSLVDGSGCVAVGDPPPGRDAWKIRVDNVSPKSKHRVLRVARQAVASSGRASDVVQIEDEVYARLVHPLTGIGTLNLAAVTVAAPRAWQAAALARASAVMGERDTTRLIRATPNTTAWFHHPVLRAAPRE